MTLDFWSFCFQRAGIIGVCHQTFFCSVLRGLNPGFHACWIGTPLSCVFSPISSASNTELAFPFWRLHCHLDTALKSECPILFTGDTKVQRHSWHVPSHITSLKTWNPVSHFEFCYLYTKFLNFPHASQNMSGVKWDEFDTPSCRPSRSESDSWLPYIVVWPQARTWPPLTSFSHLFHTLRIK